MERNYEIGISYIIASKDKEHSITLATLKLHGEDEIIIENKESIAKAYNEGIPKAKNIIKCFIQDDVEIFNSDGLRNELIAHCTNNIGMVGVIGNKNKSIFPWWESKLECCGNVFDKRLGLIDFGVGGTECSLLDGILLATSQKLTFDESYNGFHLYDMDICQQMIEKGLQNYCLKNGSHLVKHHTTGPLDISELGSVWKENSKKYENKWLRKKVKVVIAIPNEGSTHWMAYDNHSLMMIHLGTIAERSKHEPVTKDGAIFEFFHFTAGRMLTPAAREALADSALSAGMDYMLMIDDDMLCPADLFEKLYDHNVDIVAPLAFTRNAPHYAVIYACESGVDPVSREEYFINHYARNYPENELVRCDAVGFGAALIKMDVIRQMKKPYFMSTCGTGEDILFCYNAQKVGAKVFMDTATKLTHITAPILVDEYYAKNYWKNHEKRDVKKEYSFFDKYKDMRELVNK